MNKKISKSIYKKNIILFVFSCLLATVTSMLFIALAIILQKFIDYSINKDINNIVALTTISGILLPSGAVGMYAGYAIKNLYTKRATLNLKNTLVEYILRLDMRSFNNESNGTYISRLSNDITVIQNDYIKGTVEIVVQLTMLVGGVLMMFIINSILALSILLTCIIPLAVSSVFNNRMQKAQCEVAEQNKSYVSFIKDILSGNQVVKSFNIEKEIFERAKAKANKQEKAKMVYENLLSLIMSLTDISTFLVAVVIFVVGTRLLMKGDITVGEIMAFIQLLNCVTVPINRLITGFTKRQASRALLMNFNKIGEAKIDQSHRVDIPEFSNSIILEGLSFSVDEKKILNDINFEFEYGKSYAIVGTSGSGKTTLLKMITGFYDGYEGNISYDGVDLGKISDQSIFQNVSFIHQDCFIFDDTIEQNIKLFRECESDEFEQVIKKSMLQKLINDRGGIDVLCGENGIHFSGGEKQRISIARALLRKSPILLMDEATSALDNQTARDIECMLSEMQNITRIAITHRMDESILSGYDEIVLLRNGKIEEHGTYHELMEAKKGFYALSMLSSYNSDFSMEVE
ncbi:ABC-type multidrug transport system fused ATPase/permease subunit [Mobilisporobacter senegalensis]|uniref:ABC-type multidrug transport system fused ATPase/permease subunit n=1 Tax=Mobilisporobacter senegalensis TaxID=1329262 RepID=A0A3N1XLC3_9FIRM|nr:ABC transporter ATP-binding protein [Mobilisporobacter senegalensis]ROR25862.1 ABC-type multidrug transport system fused ATPase/permease subunit [Mobilisporobacter senegalensis]